jgi:hypothetical protein
MRASVGRSGCSAAPQPTTPAAAGLVGQAVRASGFAALPTAVEAAFADDNRALDNTLARLVADDSLSAEQRAQLDRLLDLVPGRLLLHTSAAVATRRVADARDRSDTAGLAQALHTLSNRLAAVVRQEEGLAAIKEAVTIYRRVAAARPHVYRQSYVDARRHLRDLYRAAGIENAAITAHLDADLQHWGGGE